MPIFNVLSIIGSLRARIQISFLIDSSVVIKTYLSTFSTLCSEFNELPTSLSALTAHNKAKFLDKLHQYQSYDFTITYHSKHVWFVVVQFSNNHPFSFLLWLQNIALIESSLLIHIHIRYHCITSVSA